MFGVSRLQFRSITAVALIGLLPAPLQALSIGAGIGVGGSSVDASSSVGGGGVSAGASASVGGTASVEASVGVGGSTVGASASVGGTTTPGGTTVSPTQPGIVSAAPAPSASPALLVLIGMTLMSSDNVPLGKVIAAEQRADGTMMLRVSISDYIKTDKKTARVVFNRPPRHGGTVRLAMTAKRFAETL